MTFASTYQRLSDSWVLCGAGTTVQDIRERARSKVQSVNIWGPSMSTDDGPTGTTDQDPDNYKKTPNPGAPSQLERSKGTDSTKSSDSSPKVAPPPSSMDQGGFTPVKFSGWTSFPLCNNDTTMKEEGGQTPQGSRRRKSLIDYMDGVCAASPFHPRNLDETALKRSPSLGIGPLEAPGSGRSHAPSNSTSGGASVETSETPADRRRQRHAKRSQQSVMTPHEDIECTLEEVVAVARASTEGDASVSVTKKKDSPLEHFTVDKSSAVDLERTISELTMRSSYGAATAKVPENRRMAYYAVGKHHRQSGRGGNRRCYFTGKLILSGAPFYAGSVQQGLRTLVVFCLPSSLGLPKETSVKTRDGASGLESNTAPPSKRSSVAGARSILSQSKGVRATNSKRNYSDDVSLSVGEELDPNWGLDSEYLLRILPEPDSKMLEEMARRFPEQFETLPVQVRVPNCWKLYVTFCFFSGLPVAEGELHYKVRDEVADVFGEDVILSHDVMEAVNGHDSAEILRLPNQETFRYLRKHYAQQSSKLPDEVFQRMAWEMVRAEV